MCLIWCPFPVLSCTLENKEFFSGKECLTNTPLQEKGLLITVFYAHKQTATIYNLSHVWRTMKTSPRLPTSNPALLPASHEFLAISLSWKAYKKNFIQTQLILVANILQSVCYQATRWNDTNHTNIQNSSTKWQGTKADLGKLSNNKTHTEGNLSK